MKSSDRTLPSTEKTHWNSRGEGHTKSKEDPSPPSLQTSYTTHTLHWVMYLLWYTATQTPSRALIKFSVYLVLVLLSLTEIRR